MRGAVRAACVALAAAMLVLAPASRAVATEGAPAGDDAHALFTEGVNALTEGRPSDAIANLEALGDRGVVDAVASFDRGLAYAQRVRAGNGVPGDLGRAAQGFEEARSLAQDHTLDRDATLALSVVRAEVARRRALAGQPVDVDPGVPLGRAVVELASEDVWAGLALLASVLLAGSLFVRWRAPASARRLRIGAAIAMGVASPVLALGAVLALAARDDRLHLREGVVVAEAARVADDHHVAFAGAAPLPEAARVTIDEAGAGWARIRFGAARGWVPSSTVRPIARPE